MFETFLSSSVPAIRGTVLRYSTALAIPAIVFCFSMGTAKADCATMLAALFNQPSNGEGRVAATVTRQYAAGYLTGYWSTATTTPEVDPVYYSNGVLAAPVSMWWPAGGGYNYLASTIYGTLGVRTNATNPVFAFGPRGLNLAINTNGQISVQELLNGVPIGGAPPTVYQGVCSGGLITVVDQSTSWTISLGTYFAPPPRNPPQ
jgi:hypothetical protein